MKYIKDFWNGNMHMHDLTLEVSLKYLKRNYCRLQVFALSLSFPKKLSWARDILQFTETARNFWLIPKDMERKFIILIYFDIWKKSEDHKVQIFVPFV